MSLEKAELDGDAAGPGEGGEPPVHVGEPEEVGGEGGALLWGGLRRACGIIRALGVVDNGGNGGEHGHRLFGGTSNGRYG